MPKLTDYIYILLTIAFTVYGQLILKWRIGVLQVSLPAPLSEKLMAIMKLLFDPFVMSGLAGGLLASFAWMAAMTKFELSTAYPFMALNFVFVMIIAIPLFGETLTYPKLIGTVLIILGTVIIGRG